MKKFVKFNRQRGIGLLELMLSLAIIAVLLIMATRYYQSARRNQQINEAVDMFNGATGGYESCKLDNKPSDCMSLDFLVANKYLPSSYVKGSSVSLSTGGDGPIASRNNTASPWGTNFKMSASGTGTYIIEMENLQSKDCDDVANRVDQTMSGKVAGTGSSRMYSAVCVGDSTVKATYPS